MRRLLTVAAAALVTAGALAACEALWDLPGQMRPPHGSSGSPPPAIQIQEEKLP